MRYRPNFFNERWVFYDDTYETRFFDAITSATLNLRTRNSDSDPLIEPNFAVVFRRYFATHKSNGGTFFSSVHNRWRDYVAPSGQHFPKSLLTSEIQILFLDRAPSMGSSILRPKIPTLRVEIRKLRKKVHIFFTSLSNF